jgi:hypothetical protein
MTTGAAGDFFLDGGVGNSSSSESIHEKLSYIRKTKIKLPVLTTFCLLRFFVDIFILVEITDFSKWILKVTFNNREKLDKL